MKTNRQMMILMMKLAVVGKIDLWCRLHWWWQSMVICSSVDLCGSRLKQTREELQYPNEKFRTGEVVLSKERAIGTSRVNFQAKSGQLVGRGHRLREATKLLQIRVSSSHTAHCTKVHLQNRICSCGGVILGQLVGPGWPHMKTDWSFRPRQGRPQDLAIQVIIWVSLPRTGKMAILCPFFSKVEHSFG